MGGDTVTTTTYSDGGYMMDLLPGDGYVLHVIADGYSSAVAENVEVLPNAPR